MGLYCVERNGPSGLAISRTACGARLGLWVLLLVTGAAAGSVAAQDEPVSKPALGEASQGEAAAADGQAASGDLTAEPAGTLRFSFDGARWRDVIKWLTDESSLALHIGDLPTGSFTYSDPRAFTLQEAIDRINLFLLPQGFTLVRSGRLLSVIDLSDPRSMRQLEVLAKLVTVEQLDALPDHEVVKCIFPLGELKAEDAVEELSALKFMTTPAVFTKTNQLMITDTAGKLRSVKRIVAGFQPSTLDNGTVVKSFALQHVDAEDILIVARPHMGLATGEMIGIDVSISADLQGKNIFVTGVEDKVQLIESLVLAIDKPSVAISNDGESVLQSHFVEGGNVEVVYNVLLTLLADKPVRLSMDETAGSVVALATPEVQTEIAETVRQLQASVPEFEVIPLKTVDPHFAVSLLEEMLDLPDVFDDPEAIDPDAPKIDADPGNMRLFVRAKRAQIEQIKKIVAGLDAGNGAAGGDELRVFPLTGRQAERVLETAAKFWRLPNPIILLPSATEPQLERTERVVAGEPARVDASKPILAQRHPQTPVRPQTPSSRVLTEQTGGQAPVIRCQLTVRGLLLQSEDTEALDQFEQHLRTIVGPEQSLPSAPIVFYLKYAKPVDALRLLAELLDGGESLRGDEEGTLVNGYVSSANSALGSFVTSRDGTTTLIADTITVAADSRLNRLIVQGTASDIELIENYLKIIDKDSSITAVETYGTAHMIELVHIDANEVAAVIREAYAGRIGGASGARQTNQATQPGQPSPSGAPNRKGASPLEQRDAAPGKEQAASQPAEAKKAAPKKAANPPARSLEPTMTIAVHAASNSLIVIAPEQLFREIEQLAQLMDVRSEQAVGILSTTSGAALELMLQQALTGEDRSNRGRSESTPRPTFTPSSTTNAVPQSPVSRNRGGR